MQAKAGDELIFSINQTSTDGDCDVYINRIAFPTRSAWIRRDITTKKNMEITLGKSDTTESGRYIAGVYGFVACGYSISGQNKGAVSCPKACSNHGTCGPTGVCSCNAGWTGPACDSPANLGTDGTPIVDSVAKGVWKYYTTVISTVPTLLSYNLTQTTTGDVDLYIGFNSAPTVVEYLAANTTMSMTSTIEVEAIQAGTYYAGVLGFWDGGNGAAVGYSLSLKADLKKGCKNTTKCSNHGTCNPNDQCSCNSAYKGKDCEERQDALALGQKVTGYVSDSMWNYYRYVGTSNKEVTISLKQDSSTPAGDCDLYVRAEGKPTQTEYDYAELGSATVFNVTIPEPLDTTWYIGVFGWASCAYSLTAVNRDTKTCGNGTWDESIDGCICNPGWTGDDCNEPTNVLKNGEVKFGTIKYMEWAYFTIVLTGTHSVEIRMKEDNSSIAGSAWLYVSSEGFPTLHTYDKSDSSTADRVHSVALSSKGPAMYGNVYIGIYGSPYGKANEVLSYSLVAWFPNFR